MHLSNLGLEVVGLLGDEIARVALILDRVSKSALKWTMMTGLQKPASPFYFDP